MNVKKWMLTAAALLLSASFASSAKAQQVLTEGPLNEVKINLPMALAGNIELSYDRILLEDLSLGVAASAAWEDSYPYKFAVMPYTRWFFWKHRGQDEFPGAGFFIEVNAGFFDCKYTKINTISNGMNGGLKIDSEDANGFGAGLGLAIGWKWISKSGFVGEIYTGAGRNFVSTTKDDVPAYIRSGISLGYRF